MLHIKSIATVCILSLSLGLAAPAQALGKNERNVLKGIVAALIVGAIVNEGRKSQAAPAPQPVNRAPVYQEPVYQSPTYQPPTYQAPRHQRPRTAAPQPGVKTGRVIGGQSPYGSGIQDTTAARVFNSYSVAERVAIQRQLASFGYYSGSLDGAFGPRTHQAVYDFARTAGKQSALESTAGAYQVYAALLG